MRNVTEIYADTMTGFSLSVDGSIAKLVLSSARPDEAGRVKDEAVVILTMPTRGMQTMLNDIAGAIQQASNKASGPKN